MKIAKLKIFKLSHKKSRLILSQNTMKYASEMTGPMRLFICFGKKKPKINVKKTCKIMLSLRRKSVCSFRFRKTRMKIKLT